eukprot:COSAG01_NODE_15746_length_1304_cov_0.702075_1_plen_65_part_00
MQIVFVHALLEGDCIVYDRDVYFTESLLYPTVTPSPQLAFTPAGVLTCHGLSAWQSRCARRGIA